jgi:hypothetical protein
VAASDIDGEEEENKTDSSKPDNTTDPHEDSTAESSKCSTSEIV